jgi:GDP-L-fucose synthase
MQSNSKIFIAGHRGLVGSSLSRLLTDMGYHNIITADKSALDLRRQKDVNRWFYDNRPEYVFLAAAKVGGIGYNKEFPADFIYDNLQIQNNVINASYHFDVKKLMFLGSACIYPKVTPQPIKEEYLLTAPLEPTNEGYALAKIAGLKMCKFYNQQHGFNAISVMPANLYGPNDNFNINECHVIPAMIWKFHNAKISGDTSVTLFGDGSPTREFLYIDDLAESLLFLMNEYDSPDHINIGTGEEYSISQLAGMVAEIVGYGGQIEWDVTKPNGTPRRKLDITRLNGLGWKAETRLYDGLAKTYDWFRNNV